MVKWREVAGKPVREDTAAVQPETRVLFKDLEIVRLTMDFDGPDGRIPKGTVGTVLQVFDRGKAYQVEFEGPHDVPETVQAEALERAG
jgi:hypothetical protein